LRYTQMHPSSRYSDQKNTGEMHHMMLNSGPWSYIWSTVHLCSPCYPCFAYRALPWWMCTIPTAASRRCVSKRCRWLQSRPWSNRHARCAVHAGGCALAPCSRPWRLQVLATSGLQPNIAPIGMRQSRVRGATEPFARVLLVASIPSK
jgi:hypothetical protein